MFSIKMNIRVIAIAVVSLGCSISLFAQTDRTEALVTADQNGWEYELKAGVNIGGSAPLPMPVEIRKITSYNPRFNGTIEGTATKWLGKDHRWGVSVGLKFEEKGMLTDARVKNYKTEIVNEGSHVAGYWTGNVQTDYHSTLLSIPVMANYRISDRWKVRAGVYSSIKLDGNFSGHVSNGYLRESTPVGQKLSFDEGKTAFYDFTSSLRSFHCGAQVGATWRAFNHFTVNADVTWAANGIFKKDFNTISFKLYPIYLNIGFGYRF